MLFYLTLISLLLFSVFKYPYKKTGLLRILILCFLSMFRAESVGTDTAHYMEFEENIEKFVALFSHEDFEIGRTIEISYLSIILFLYEYELSPRYLILLMSVITFIFLHLALKRSKSSYSVGVLIFFLLFYFPSLNIARQICACCILLYAFTFLFEEGNKKYIFFLLVLLATSFHASSILYVLFYIIRFFKFEKYNRNILSQIAVLLFFINSLYPLPISEWLVSCFGNLSYSELYSDRSVSQSRSLFGIIYSFVQISSYYLMFKNYSNKKLDRDDFIFYCIIITLIISSTANSDFSRIFLPLQFYQIFYICNLYKTKKMNIKSTPFVYYISVNTLLLMYSLSTGAGEVIPYMINLKF